MHRITSMDPTARITIETTAFLTVAGALAKVLPPVAAAVAIIWYGIQIWQSEVGKNWRARWWRLIIGRGGLSFSDQVCFITLGLAGGGVAIALWAVSRIIQ